MSNWEEIRETPSLRIKEIIKSLNNNTTFSFWDHWLDSHFINHYWVILNFPDLVDEDPQNFQDFYSGNFKKLSNFPYYHDYTPFKEWEAMMSNTDKRLFWELKELTKDKVSRINCHIDKIREEVKCLKEDSTIDDWKKVEEHIIALLGIITIILKPHIKERKKLDRDYLNNVKWFENIYKAGEDFFNEYYLVFVSSITGLEYYDDPDCDEKRKERINTIINKIKRIWEKISKSTPSFKDWLKHYKKILLPLFNQLNFLFSDNYSNDINNEVIDILNKTSDQ